MEPAQTIAIAPGVTWVGAEDFRVRMSDALVPLPFGDSQNAYLVAGKRRVALIDTVGPAFALELRAKVASLISLDRLDYIVSNHAEPDHGGSITEMMTAAPHAQLVTTRKGCELAESLYRVPEERRLAVREGDTLDLGGKTLLFFEAPWLHWPETMFTYLVEDRILFTCDFLSAHIASNKLFDDEASEMLLAEAKRNYATVMMPFSKMAASGLDKIKPLGAAIIAPGHGPVYRNPNRILEAGEKWVRGPLSPKIVVAYVSMWGNTERLARALIAALSTEGIDVAPYDLAVSDLSNIARDLVDASAMALGSPTMLGGLHPLAASALSMIRGLRPRLKLCAFFGSYGWGGGAAIQAKTMLQPLGCELVGELDVKGSPGDKEMGDAEELGHKLARRIKESLGRT